MIRFFLKFDANVVEAMRVNTTVKDPAVTEQLTPELEAFIKEWQSAENNTINR